MNDIYHISPEIRILVQKNKTYENRLLKEKILNREMIPTVIIWNDTVIDDIDIYEMCIDKRIEFRICSMEFPSVYHAYSWICSNQLKRNDLTNTMKRFLLGYMAMSESAIHRNEKEKKLLEIRTRKEAIDIIAKCYDISTICVFNYKRLAECILKINEISPVLADCVLNEKFKITSQQILILESKTSQEIMQLTKEISKYDNNIPKFNELIRKINLDRQLDCRSNKKNVFDTVPEIRKMPEYDPDAELTSLSLTLYSWINSINRICNTDVSSSSFKAKNDLVLALGQLSDSARELSQYLEGSF